MWYKHYLKFVAAVALNAAVYISYRLYMQYIKNEVTPLSLSEVKELISKNQRDIEFSVLILNFTKHQEKLKNIPLVKWEDDLDKITGAFFLFKNYVFCIRKYNNTMKYSYTLYTEAQQMTKNHESVKDLTQDFLKALQLDSVDVSWTNESWK